MSGSRTRERDLKNFVLPEIGRLEATEDEWEPYRLIDPEGQRVEPVAIYFKDLLAADSPATTLYSYGNDLLRWWRFLWAEGLEWDRALREDARDFTLWMQLADKPVRVHWRHRGKDLAEIPTHGTSRCGCSWRTNQFACTGGTAARIWPRYPRPSLELAGLRLGHRTR